MVDKIVDNLDEGRAPAPVVRHDQARHEDAVRQEDGARRHDQARHEDAVRHEDPAPHEDAAPHPDAARRQDQARQGGQPGPRHGFPPARPRVEDELRDAIVSGRFQPNERLVEADLTEALGVGRATVRTALARLEQEGLVEHERNRGARVRLVAEWEAVEILEARAVLEGLVARQAASKATEPDVEALRRILERMRRLLDRGDLLGASDENAMLHRRLLGIAGHETAARLISTLKSQLVRFQYRTILLPGRSGRSFAEHRSIVEAVAARDPDAAEAAMRTHLSHVADALRSAGEGDGAAVFPGAGEPDGAGAGHADPDRDDDSL